jgi:hypothetical protein
MWIVQKLREMLSHQARSTQYLAEIAAGNANQQRLTNEKLTEAIASLKDITNVLRAKLDALIAGSNEQQRLLNDRLNTTIAQLDGMSNLLRTRLDAVAGDLERQTRLVNQKLDAISSKKE